MPRLGRRESGAFAVAGIYLALGALWIVASDRLVRAGWTDTAKGLGFVAASALVMYALVRARDRRIAATEASYRVLFEGNPLPMWLFDPATRRFLAVNDAAIESYGWSRREFLAMRLDDIRPPEEVGLLIETVAAPRDRVNHAGLRRHTRRDRTTLWADVTAYDIEFAGRPARLAVAIDATARVAAAEAVAVSEERFRSIIEAGIDVVLTVDETGTIRSANGAAEHLLGWAPADLVGRPVSLIAGGEHAELHPTYLDRFLETGEARILNRTRELIARRRDGRDVPIELSVVEIPTTGTAREFAGVIHDVSERAAYEAALLRGATIDDLTGLPNRVLLLDRVRGALDRARREDTDVALVMVDLDAFATINQVHGYEAGDRLLHQVAERLVEVVGPNVARYGSDAFCVVLESIAAEDDAGRVAERMLERVREHFETPEGRLWVTASAGVATSPRGRGEPETLVRDADAALHRAKASGGGRVDFFDEALRQSTVERNRLERDLREAVDANEFTVVYQPQIVLATGAVAGVEALVRWRRNGALTLPATFIEAAEQTGLIDRIGELVLDTALADAAEWRRSTGGPVPISVNVSPHQLRDGAFVRRVAATLARHGVEPQHLTIEVTETALLEGLGVLDAVEALAALGIDVSVDDFGTHYASLTNLRSLPYLREIKLERQFAHGLTPDATAADLAIVRAAIALASGVGLRLVMEGVEETGQAERLAELGGEIAQGYLFGRPCDAAKIAAELQRRGVAR